MPSPSSIALAVLVALVVLSPWPFGSVHLRTAQAIVLLALGTALLALALPLLGRSASAGRAVAQDSGAEPPVGAMANGGSARSLPTKGLGLSRADLDSHAAKAALCALGLWLLGALQLVPLPPALHALLAPGSASVWHPAEAAAAAVLGAGPHPVSVYPAATARWLAFFAAMVALALLAAPALRERRTLLRSTVVVVAMAVVLTLYAFVARLWFADRLFGVFEALIPPFGPFVSKNHFAGYVEMAALLAVGLATGLASEARTGPGPLGWIESPRASRVVLAWAAAAVLVLAVPVSLSRGGVISLAVGLIAFALLRTTSRRSGSGQDLRTAVPPASRSLRGIRTFLIPLAAALVAVALAIAAYHFVLPEPARARIATIAVGGGDTSSSYRLGLWRDTLRLVASSPVVGSGVGGFADAVPRFKTGAGDVRVEHAESDVLEVLAEGGLLGGALTAAALAFLFAAAWRALRDDPHRLTRGVRTGALAALVALGVHSLFDFNLHIPSNALLAALLTAFVVVPAGELSGRSARGLAATALLSAVFALATPWADVRTFAVAASAQAGSLRRSAGERNAVADLRHRPADAQTWLVLAWLRLPASVADASSLAGVAARLDPTNEPLAKAAARVSRR